MDKSNKSRDEGAELTRQTWFGQESMWPVIIKRRARKLRSVSGAEKKNTEFEKTQFDRVLSLKESMPLKPWIFIATIFCPSKGILRLRMVKWTAESCVRSYYRINNSIFNTFKDSFRTFGLLLLWNLKRRGVYFYHIRFLRWRQKFPPSGAFEWKGVIL